MIEFVDAPVRKRLHECPVQPPRPWQMALLFTSLELVSRVGLLPRGYCADIRPVRRDPGVVERGCVVGCSDGRLLVVLDVTLPPDLFAEVLLHELAHVRHFLDHDDFRRNRIYDADEFQRLTNETEAFADRFAKEHLGDATLQAAVRGAQDDEGFRTRLSDYPGQWPTRAQSRISDAVVSLALRRGLFPSSLPRLHLRTVFAPAQPDLKGFTVSDEGSDIVCWINANIRPGEFADAVARECAQAAMLLRPHEDHGAAERFVSDFARQARSDSAVDAAVRAAEREAAELEAARCQ